MLHNRRNFCLIIKFKLCGSHGWYQSTSIILGLGVQKLLSATEVYWTRLNFATAEQQKKAKP